VGIVAANFGTLITALYSLGLLLGTLYSVPPFRLKRFALPAFLIIATVRHGGALQCMTGEGTQRILVTGAPCACALVRCELFFELPPALGVNCILAVFVQVRGLLLNFGVYYATRAALALPFAWR